jgi:drug/metabolite transporter (DMT)-like permease
MIALILSIVCSALLVLIFKIFEQRTIPVFQAIVFNYISATVCAFVFLSNKQEILNGTVFSSNWLPLSLVLGCMFIAVFNLTSLATIRFGVSTASVAMKLGLVFPVLLAFTIYGESFNWLKLLGILFAFAAVILSSLKNDLHVHEKSSLPVLPFVVFLGSGACDSLTQYANKKYLANSGIEEFSLFLFATAATCGSIILLFQFLRGHIRFNLHSLIGGAVLGVINYFSFLFILEALAKISWGSSVVFPVSNLGVVALATAIGVVAFKEKISKTNMLGLLLAAISITLIIFSNIIKP